MKPINVTSTHRPAQGLGAFVRTGLGLGSLRQAMHGSAQDWHVPVGYCGLDRTEDKLQPGEEHA